MLKAIKICWLQHLKDVEEWKKQDIAKKRLIVRAYVMRYYEVKYKMEGNQLPYWIEANRELEEKVKTDKDVLFYYNIIKKYIKNI